MTDRGGAYCDKDDGQNREATSPTPLVQAELQRRQAELRKVSQVSLPKGQRAGPPPCTTIFVRGAPRETRLVDLEAFLTVIMGQAPKDSLGNAPEMQEEVPRLIPRGAYILSPEGIKKTRHPNRLTWGGSIAVYCDEKDVHSALNATCHNMGTALTGCNCVMEVSDNQGWVMETRRAIAQ